MRVGLSSKGEATRLENRKWNQVVSRRVPRFWYARLRL